MYCKNCGLNNTPDAHFCARCGAALDGPADPVQPPLNAQPAPLAPEMQGFPGAPSTLTPVPVKKRGIRWWHILLIVVAAVFVALIIFGLVRIASSPADQPSGGAYSYTPDIPYTKGTITGNTYVNEWANLQFTFPEEFVQQDPSAFEYGESEYGFYLLSPGSHMIAVAFEDLSNLPSITEDFYIDQLSALMQKQAESNTYTVTSSEEHQDVTIAGETYRSARLYLNYEDVGLTLVESVYVHKIDNRMCVIMSMSDSGEQNDAIAAQFQPVSTAQ